MYTFTNITTKKQFVDNLDYLEVQIKPRKMYCNQQRGWEASDRFGHIYNIVFSGNVNKFFIFNVCSKPSDEPFKVDLISCGDKVEIHQAVKNGRHLKANKFLRQFANLAMMVNCLAQFGYLN